MCWGLSATQPGQGLPRALSRCSRTAFSLKSAGRFRESVVSKAKGVPYPPGGEVTWGDRPQYNTTKGKSSEKCEACTQLQGRITGKSPWSCPAQSSVCEHRPVLGSLHRLQFVFLANTSSQARERKWQFLRPCSVNTLIFLPWIINLRGHLKFVNNFNNVLNACYCKSI